MGNQCTYFTKFLTVKNFILKSWNNKVLKFRISRLRRKTFGIRSQFVLTTNCNCFQNKDEPTFNLTTEILTFKVSKITQKQTICSLNSNSTKKCIKKLSHIGVTKKKKISKGKNQNQNFLKMYLLSHFTT